MSEAEDALQGIRHIKCGECKKVMYRVAWCAGRGNVLADEGRIPPITIIVRENFRFVFCSKSCLVVWIKYQPAESFVGGYPLL